VSTVMISVLSVLIAPLPTAQTTDDD